MQKGRSELTPTESLAARVDKIQAKFGPNQNIATGQRCELCDLIDFCSHGSGGGACQAELLENNRHYRFNLERLIDNLFQQ